MTEHAAARPRRPPHLHRARRGVLPLRHTAVEPSGLAVEPVSDSYGEALRFHRGTKLTCYFYAKSHQGFQFATRVIGWEKIGGKEAMVLAHSDAVSALPARRHERRETKAPCTFYRVAVTAAKSKGQPKSAAKVSRTSPTQGR